MQQRATRAIDSFNRQVRKNSFIRTEVLEQPNGDALAVMHLDDEMGSLMTLELTSPSTRQAAFLTRAFQQKADVIFRLVTEQLTAKESKEED